MARRSDEKIFLDTLTYMAGEPPENISSRALLQELGWNDDRYQRVRSRLIDAGVIKGVLGGPGGSLKLLTGAKPLADIDNNKLEERVISAFISYSHVDAKLKSDLIKHLAPLNRLGLISHWNDAEIKVGEQWENKILDKITTSDLIILLVSSDFIASEFCYTKELGIALQRDSQGMARILPVILRPCLWQDLPFGKLQAAPREGKPITSWPSLDEAMTEVAKSVKEAALLLRTVKITH